jgi:chaperonin cofactor prefoldin
MTYEKRPENETKGSANSANLRERVQALQEKVSTLNQTLEEAEQTLREASDHSDDGAGRD